MITPAWDNKGSQRPLTAALAPRGRGRSNRHLLPPPCRQQLEFTRQRRRRSANQSARITTVCSGFQASHRLSKAGNGIERSLGYPFACTTALELSTHYCCPAFSTGHHECPPLLLLTAVLVCSHRNFKHDSTFLYNGSEMAPRWPTMVRVYATHVR